MKSCTVFRLSGLRSTPHPFSRHYRLVGKACTMADRPDACRASLTPDSSTSSNNGLPVHSFENYSNEYHGRTSCSCTWHHCIHTSDCRVGPLSFCTLFLFTLCSCVSLYLVPIPQTVTREPPKFVCLLFVQTNCFLHFCFTLNRSCGPAGHSLNRLVYSCLTHLSECESP